MLQSRIRNSPMVGFAVVVVCATRMLFPGIGFATLVAILVGLSNIKAFPFVWHLRVLPGFVLTPTPPSASANKCSRLFAPHTCTSHTPLLEIDYNLHKSNSTYFSDLDISRSRLLLSLFRAGLARLTQDQPNAPCTIALGGAACNFHKAIPPLGRYRMVSRVLCWDRKWLYVATQFRSAGEDQREGGGIVFATALARYVVKAGGRVTVPPEKLLDASELLGAEGSPARKEAERRRERALRLLQTRQTQHKRLARMTLVLVSSLIAGSQPGSQILECANRDGLLMSGRLASPGPWRRTDYD
ncbi:uncharacterized protein BDR25DRAFT_341579 [Lindgomyces ingoldianus]|uniref:Uncharacterized protein n=1 Tax=Lindgomyces ingoldianus TaxID=673940 RepID=A0ACB6R1L6_9PLEO|nr:uncharacterized protein BDR25DRAFT_341579 [Lindgomyces ingoldianus]KAF2472675.1 hypothetical protein BDR25DRAFT_341579 [Lindgomyces ingoldianus]